MKTSILSTGHGTRLRPITYSQQKQLIPVANKPVLFYAIEDVLEAGAREIGIIVGPNKEQETVEGAHFDADHTIIEQDAPRGLAHTVLISEAFLGDELFVMYLGDNILKECIIQHAEDFRKKNSDAYPKVPPSKFVLAGIYFFTQKVVGNLFY